MHLFILKYAFLISSTSFAFFSFFLSLGQVLRENPTKTSVGIAISNE